MAKIKSIKKKTIRKEFYNVNFPVYMHFALQYVHDEDICKDIVQDTFISYWETIDNFTDELSIKAFFYKTIRNKCINQIRHNIIREKYFSELPEDWETEDFFMENVVKEEVTNILLNEIDKLSPTNRKIILMSLEGFSNEEISNEFKITVNTVKTHKARSYIILRKNLSYIRCLILLLT